MDRTLANSKIIYKHKPLLITLPPAHSVLGPSASQAEKASFFPSIHPSLVKSDALILFGLTEYCVHTTLSNTHESI